MYPRIIIIIAAPMQPIEPDEATLEELKRIADSYPESSVLMEAPELHPEYRPNYDQRRQRLMAGHPHKTYWHRIRSNPG